tara:strand:+ start:616 stop:1032 length:417 start_codon:yes stop_codon:yes gene_type:complete
MFNSRVRDSFLGDFDSVFNALVLPNRKYSLTSGQTTPKANISRDNTGYQVSLAAPGFARGDFDIEVNENVLTISTEASQVSENSVRQEYSFSKFSRSFSLPENVLVDSISAEYVAGILNVNIPVEDVKINKTKKVEVN